MVSGAVLIQGLARDARAGLAAITQTPYCIYGNGDGGSWTWTIQSYFGELSGAPAGVTGTPADVRDLFVSSIETARTGAGQVYPAAAAIAVPAFCTATPVAAFQIETVGTHTLFVEPISGPPEVAVVGPDITAAVDFNPKIFIPVPEPGTTTLLISGVLALAALRSMSARR